MDTHSVEFWIINYPKPMIIIFDNENWPKLLLHTNCSLKYESFSLKFKPTRCILHLCQLQVRLHKLKVSFGTICTQRRQKRSATKGACKKDGQCLSKICVEKMHGGNGGQRKLQGWRIWNLTLEFNELMLVISRLDGRDEWSWH